MMLLRYPSFTGWYWETKSHQEEGFCPLTLQSTCHRVHIPQLPSLRARACGERAVWLHPLSRHDVQGSTVLSLSDYMQCLLQVFRKKIKVYFMINLTPMTQVIITRWYLVCYWFQHFHHLTLLENLKYPKTGNPWLYFFNSTEVSSSTSNSP